MAGLHIAGTTCTCNVFFLSVFFVPIDRPTGICKRIKQFFEEAAVAMPGERKLKKKLIVFNRPIRGALCYIGPIGPCQGPSGEEKIFEMAAKF